VALGIGAAVITGYGCGPAWAQESTPDDATSQTSEPSEPGGVDTGAQPDPDSEPEPDEDPDLDLDGEIDLADEDLEGEVEADIEVEADKEPEEIAETSDNDEVPELPDNERDPVTGRDDDPPPAFDATPATEPDEPEVSADVDEQPGLDAMRVTSDTEAHLESTVEQAFTTSTVITPPKVPSLRPWPTAFDPATAVNYVVDLVASFVNMMLSPFAAGLPAPPSGPPTLWTVLAWVRREFFNSTPTIAYDPALNSQTVDENGDPVIIGSIGASDVDGDKLTYTVIGRPRYGGVVEVAEDGTFTYRPMNAMAAVGGYDEFIVVVDDEASGFHLNGPLGLLQFVPVIGNLIVPGGGHRVARTIRVEVTPVEGVDLSFPADFHWGVAHSGFQAEGGPGAPVDPNSDWYKWVHDRFNQLFGLTNGVPENGPGAYVMYDEDAALAADQLKMNTFRIGIEWSRVFPNSTASVNIRDEGGTISLADLEALDALANQEEVQHYRDVLASLRAHGLEPMVTVTHFTLPAWVHDPGTTRLLAQFGLPAPAAGWLSPDTATEFEKYAAYLAWKYGDQVDNWATLNEPVPPVLTQFFALPGLVPSWPPGVIRPDLASTFLVNQARAHVAAYEAIHAWDNTSATAGQPEAFVGFTNNMLPNRPANPINPLDVDAANAWNRMFNEWFLNAVIDGWVDANLDGVKTPDEIHPEFVGKTDFVGVQYYGSERMQGIGFAPIPGFPFFRGIPLRCQPSSPTCSDFNQPIDPGGFREVLEVAASYGKPLWVTENGIADANDTKRPGYIATHIAVVQDLVAHGADIRGYTYWSFVDNLEWSEGYHLKFGLYGSDPTTPELERTPKWASIDTISGIAGSNGLPLWVLEQYVRNL
jgi:beta-galactosidase